MGARLTDVKMIESSEAAAMIKLKTWPNILIEKAIYYDNEWR
jgi:hypothetical protein